MESYTDEIENLSHTLNDIKTSVKCSKQLIKGHVELLERLEPRIEVLTTRIDSLTTRMVKYEHRKEGGPENEKNI